MQAIFHSGPVTAQRVFADNPTDFGCSYLLIPSLPYSIEIDTVSAAALAASSTALQDRYIADRKSFSSVTDIAGLPLARDSERNTWNLPRFGVSDADPTLASTSLALRPESRLGRKRETAAMDPSAGHSPPWSPLVIVPTQRDVRARRQGVVFLVMVAALVAFVTLQDGKLLVGGIMVGWFSSLAAVLSARGRRLRVVADVEQLTVVNVVRTHHLPRDEIEGFVVRPRVGKQGRRLAVMLANGHQVDLHATGSSRASSRYQGRPDLERLQSEMHDWLQAPPR